MPSFDGPAEDLKRWMAGRLGLHARLQQGHDTTMRDAYALWCAIVDSMAWQRERQGAEMDLSRFVLALRLPDLRRRAEDGDAVLAAYLSRVAGGSEGQAALYRGRHAYLASFLVGELIAEIEQVCKRVASHPAPQAVGRPSVERWQNFGLAVSCTVVGAGLAAFAIMGTSSIVEILIAGFGCF